MSTHLQVGATSTVPSQIESSQAAHAYMDRKGTKELQKLLTRVSNPGAIITSLLIRVGADKYL